MAAEYKLKPIYKKEFHEIFSDNSEHTDFGPLLVRMKVVDRDGESQMDEEQWDAASKHLSLLSRLPFSQVLMSLSLTRRLHCFCFREVVKVTWGLHIYFEEAFTLLFRASYQCLTHCAHISSQKVSNLLSPILSYLIHPSTYLSISFRFLAFYLCLCIVRLYLLANMKYILSSKVIRHTEVLFVTCVINSGIYKRQRTGVNKYNEDI